MIYKNALLAVMGLLIAAQTGAQVLVDTGSDFSVAAQGANGLFYGYYTAGESQDASLFSTSGMTVGTSAMGASWLGPQSFSTPLLSADAQHPSVDSLFPAVRRYVVGEGAEPDYTGLVRITGSFGGATPGGGGTVFAFINVNDQTLFSGTASTVVASFDFEVEVAPGDTIDFGIRAFDGPSFDTTFVQATVTAIPEPAASAVLVALVSLLATWKRRRQPGRDDEPETT